MRLGPFHTDWHHLTFTTRSSIAEWDLDETKAGGPFKEILDYDILVNCILLTEAQNYSLSHWFMFIDINSVSNAIGMVLCQIFSMSISLMSQLVSSISLARVGGGGGGR